MKPNVPLEFSDLFKTEDADDGLDVYDELFNRPITPEPPHPFEKLFRGETNDMDLTTVQSEEFCKAENEIVDRVLAKMKLFVEDVDGKRLLSERI